MATGDVHSSSPWSSRSHKSSVENKTASMVSEQNSKQPWKSSVSRAITFGSPTSSDKVSKFMRDQLETIRWYDRQRWGFDFVSEMPSNSGSSHYEWKKKSCSQVSSSATSGDYSFYGFKQSAQSESAFKSYQSTKKKK